MTQSEAANDSSITGVVPGHRLKWVDRLIQRQRIAKVRRYVPAGGRVLDIGCADGALFRQLGRRIGSGVGVDPALEQSVGNGRFQLIAGKIPHELASSGLFDAVTMLAVVEHLPDAVIAELRDQAVALLKPGGHLLITVPSTQVDKILALLTRLRLVAGMSLHEHHGFDPTNVPAWFEGAGLTLEKSAKFQLGLNNLYVFTRTGAEAKVGQRAV
jgi:2-polyprenyl-3-methyl-5-hydroxy-6-metoxy-1,4-benzoquinol methylase